VDKKVNAENTGDYPVLVRVKMEETWKLADGSTKTLKSDNKKFMDGKYENGIFEANQISDDGLVEGDSTVVYKSIKDITSDPTSSWKKGTDGYWYWNGVLEKKNPDPQKSKSKTSELMSELVMATNIDLGKYETTEYYAIADSQPEVDAEGVWDTWPSNLKDLTGDGVIDIRDLAELKKAELDGKKLFRKSESEITKDMGYADANYTLTITSEFVQATKDALWDGITYGDGNFLSNVKLDGDGVNLINK